MHLHIRVAAVATQHASTVIVHFLVVLVQPVAGATQEARVVQGPRRPLLRRQVVQTAALPQPLLVVLVLLVVLHAAHAAVRRKRLILALDLLPVQPAAGRGTIASIGTVSLWLRLIIGTIKDIINMMPCFKEVLSLID